MEGDDRVVTGLSIPLFFSLLSSLSFFFSSFFFFPYRRLMAGRTDDVEPMAQGTRACAASLPSPLPFLPLSLLTHAEAREGDA